MKTLTTRSVKDEPVDQTEMMLTMMVDQAKMHDRMYFDTDVENEDFEEALMYYVLNKEPEIMKAMNDYMQSMQTEMNNVPQ